MDPAPSKDDEYLKKCSYKKCSMRSTMEVVHERCRFQTCSKCTPKLLALLGPNARSAVIMEP